MIRYFQIGKFVFSLEHPEELTLPENFLLFEIEEVQAVDYAYTFYFVTEFPIPKAEPIVNRMDISVFRNGDLESRLIGVKGQMEPYALYREIDETHAEIFFHSGMTPYLQVDPAFASLFAFERRMADRDSFVLHCAYMVHRDEAILFSAPSETGKTTQANLWAKYRGTRQVNGDRSLLQIEEDQVTANGWPVCGTSGICHDEQFPVRAIVMLKQAKVNSVRRLRPMEAFMLIYTQVTINSWNREAVSKCSDLIEQLIAKVPVYELACDISEEAVNVLEAALTEK